MQAVLTGLLTGMAFGVVLYKVGASRYSRVIGMLTLRDTKIMKFVFVAIAVASFAYGLAAVFGVGEQLNLVPRVMPFMGMAHVVGGVLFGGALGFSGLCPGTCAHGPRPGRHVACCTIIGPSAGVRVMAADAQPQGRPRR